MHANVWYDMIILRCHRAGGIIYEDFGTGDMMHAIYFVLQPTHSHTLTKTLHLKLDRARQKALDPPTFHVLI
jgi:hypothetical protein